MALTAATAFRDYETDGVPASGVHKIKKPDMRSWGAWVEGIINAFTSNSGLVYVFKATMDGDLSPEINSMAWVIGDPTVANNGVYKKLGASGAGSWQRVTDLPFSFIIASDVGAGTANAIQATTSIPVSGSALVWMNVFEANTASPVTVSFNGGSALTIKTNSGNDVAAGGLIAGMIVMGIVSGSTFRLVSDQASAAIIAQAEDAQAAAEGAAASVNIRNVDDRTALKALNTSVTTLAFLREDGREGLFKWTSGDFSSLITADPQEGLYIKADASASSAGAWVRQGPWAAYGVRPEWFGAAADGITDDLVAMRAALKMGFTVALSKADYKVTGPLLITTTGQRIVGQGRGYGYGRPDYFARDFRAVSRIIGAGTFPRRVLTRRKYRASAADPTDDAMSAIMEIHADGVSFEDWCVWLNCDYTNLSHTNLGDDIDIGVFRGGRPGFTTKNFAIVGHFRKTKLLHDYTRALNLPELLDNNGNALPKGASGQTFAGGDGWEHHNLLMWGWGSGFTEYGPIHPGGNYYDEATGAVADQRGASGDSDGRFTGRCASYVTHQSGRRLVNPTGYGAALTRPNMEAEPDFTPAGIDIDGWAANSGSTTTGRGQVRNMIFGTMRVSSAAAFRVRLRDCDQIHFEGTTWIESGDYPSTASSWKDASGADISINDYVNTTYGHIATDSTKTGSLFADDVVGGIFQTWVASQTKFTGSQSDGAMLDRGADSGSATIADDTVLTITPPVNGGWMRLSYSPVNAPIFNQSAMFYFDCGSSLFIQAVTGAIGTNVTLATTDLTNGTADGVDGNMNVSVQAGVIKLKNRTGSSGLWRWRFL